MHARKMKKMRRAPRVREMITLLKNMKEALSKNVRGKKALRVGEMPTFLKNEMNARKE